MNTTIINDCRDANAVGRQMTRAASLIGGSVSFVGVANDLEAAGNLIDILDAYGENSGVILVNVAPRNGKAKKWPNGTPFGYFWYKKVLVVSSVDGRTLSLAKKLHLVDEVHVFDIPTVVPKWVSEKVVSEEEGRHIIDTQFRSYDFVPRIAAYLLEGNTAPSEVLSINDVEDAPTGIWFVDNFGNCKTTVLKNEIVMGTHIETKYGSVPHFERLKDVPDATTALITGSSGLAGSRFLELVTQGESTSQKFELSSGDSIL